MARRWARVRSMAMLGRYQPCRHALRRSSRPIVLRCQPSVRAMAAREWPCLRRAEIMYRSPAVIW